MNKLSAINDAALRAALGSRCLTKATLAINAASAATVKTTGATSYTINGVFYTKAALAAQSFAVTHREDGSAVTATDAAYVQPAETTVIYLVCLNAVGAVAVVQGGYAGQAVLYANDKSKVLTSDGGVPEIPAGYIAIGAVKVATAAATTFTPGTTALDAAGVTATYFDLSMVPASL